jgi:prepilin-type N-terminal cleavage/methylation domain-containing protein
MRAARAAFTLVELLVVIGIIAVLVSILLPSLSRVRETAIITKCTSNMRQIGNMMQMYAIENKDKVPIGHFNTRHHESYVISFKGSADPPETRIYPVLGHLYHSGLMKDPEAYWCPSPNHTDERWEFNTPTNKWPPELGTQFIRAGYYTRPGVTWGGGIYPPPTFGGKPNGMPKLSNFKSKAILSDLWPIPLGSIAKLAPHRHKQNVMYGDRSVVTLTIGSELKERIEFLNVNTDFLPMRFLNEDPNELGLWNLYDLR